MTTLLWDAGALAKRYTPERGSDTVDALLAPLSRRHVSAMIGYAETFSILLRRANSGALSRVVFAASVRALRTEVLDNPDFVLLSLSDDAVLSGLSLMQKHNLNATDAALLVVFLRYARTLDPADLCILISSDMRLLRAAQAEGLGTFNPETATPADTAAL